MEPRAWFKTETRKMQEAFDLMDRCDKRKLGATTRNTANNFFMKANFLEQALVKTASAAMPRSIVKNQ